MNNKLGRSATRTGAAVLQPARAFLGVVNGQKSVVLAKVCLPITGMAVGHSLPPGRPKQVAAPPPPFTLHFARVCYLLAEREFVLAVLNSQSDSRQ